MYVRLKHLKTKIDDNKDGSKNVSLLASQPPNAAASPRKNVIESREMFLLFTT